jgi:hypothetical protein
VAQAADPLARIRDARKSLKAAASRPLPLRSAGSGSARADPRRAKIPEGGRFAAAAAAAAICGWVRKQL